MELVARHGAQSWTLIAQGLGNGRNGKSCRLRWCNQLNPTVRKDPFTEQEVCAFFYLFCVRVRVRLCVGCVCVCVLLLCCLCL